MRKIGLLSAVVLLSAAPALAQATSEIVRVPSVSFQPAAAPAQAAPLGGSERKGFTILVNAGLGVQNDSGLEKTAIGLGGVNVGVGAFLKSNLAVLGRFSGTNVTFDYDDPLNTYQIKQVSGVVGGTLQYWVNDRFAVEGGAGLGFWVAPDLDLDEKGFGLILGASAVVFRRGGHNLLVGAEYAPVLTESKVHNFGITFGYQFHK